jgi:hypothetical protein
MGGQELMRSIRVGVVSKGEPSYTWREVKDRYLISLNVGEDESTIQLTEDECYTLIRLLNSALPAPEKITYNEPFDGCGGQLAGSKYAGSSCSL